MYVLDQYRGTVLSCRYEIPPRLAPEESRTELQEAFRVAVVGTIFRHPMLQVGMKDATSKNPTWIQLHSIDLAQHIKWVYLGVDEDLEQKVQETFRAKIDERCPDLSIKQPGWWVTVFRQGNAPVMEVMMSWNHPQFDGAGAKVLHEDVIGLLNAENGSHEPTGLDGDILTLPQAAPMLPTPIEMSIGLPVDPMFLLKTLWEEIRPRFLNRDATLAAWSPIRTSPYKTQFRSFFVDQASVSAILALCRENKTTFTGLVHGLALIAFSSRLDGAAAPGFQSFTIIDHRRNLPPAPPDAPWGRADRTVANYATQAYHRYETEQVARIRSKLAPGASTDGDNSGRRDLSADLLSELWAASAQSRREIVGRLEAGPRNDLIGVCKYAVTDWQKTMRDQAKRTRQFSWLVTNLGVVGRGGGGGSKPDGSHHGQGQGQGQGWSITRAQFGLSPEMPYGAIEFCPASVAGSGMCFSASWPDCAVDEALGEGIMDDMERWLAQLAGQS